MKYTERIRAALIKHMEESGAFSDQELQLVKKSGLTMFGYEKRSLMVLNDVELADVLQIIAKMLRLQSPFLANASRWAAADVYERALRK